MQHLLEKISERFELDKKEKFPSLTLIIPTYNCSEKIGRTLQSIKMQNYPLLEVIVIDGGSTDKTINIVSQYSSLVNRVYSIATYNLPEMLSRGVALASSSYISFLYPGSVYLSKYALQPFGLKCFTTHLPDLLYAGAIVRELGKETVQVKGPLSRSLLQKAVAPTLLIACWFKADLFKRIGKFNSKYVHRFALDFFCRIEKLKEKQVEEIDRFLVDFDFGASKAHAGAAYAYETLSLLKEHYGLAKTLSWFKSLNYSELTRSAILYCKDQIFFK